MSKYRNEQLNRVLQRTFKPEFLNRLDEIVIFHGLTKDDLNRIVDIQLKRVKDLLATRDIKIELTQAAKDYIVDAGSDTDFGARPLKRAIQQAMRQGAQGIKIAVGGRIGGADIARVVWLREGRVPLQTLRADIDFARTEALTTYGKIGIKVWIYRGIVLSMNEETAPAANATEGVYVSE